MTRRVTSETLIGRTSQIAALRAAVAAAATGEPRIVLLTGDAGIGKTRLVRDTVAHARTTGLLTATGGCVQLGEVSIAFAPLVEALRDARSQIGEPEFDELLGGAPQLRALLIGEADAGGIAGGLFEHLLAFLGRLSARHPILLVLEDLHWADASTRDLVTYLGRNLRNAAVTLLLTVRADEMHRRHPLRPVIAGLEREQRVERIDLHGLARAEIARLLTEIGVADPDPALIGELHARSGGNPFYVEELVAAGRLGGGLPDTLAEVILARIESLPDDVRKMLRAAAVVDDHVDDELLAQVVEQPVDEVTAALRRALDEQVLVLDGGLCRFRHALVREALYDDLLPGERTRLHIATATVLEGAEHLRPHTRWAMVAYHWDAGRDVPKAYAASIRAGTEAECVHAYADAAEQYQRALALRERLPDPDTVGGLTLAELLLRASDVVQASSRSSRALTLAEAALAELGPDAAPERRAEVLDRIGLINWTQHHGTAAVAAYEQAAALVADRPASPTKALVLASVGRSLMVRALYTQATPVIRTAIDVAGQIGTVDVEGHARCSLAPCLSGVGRVDEAFAELERAMTLCRAGGNVDHISRVYTNHSHCAYQGGRFAEIDRIAEEAFDFVARTGRVHHHGEAIAGNVIATLHAAGRWAEAEAVHDDQRIPNGDPYQELRWLPVLLDSGRLDEARVAVKTAVESSADADDVQFGALSLMIAAQLRRIEQAWDEARELLARALPLIERTDEHFYLARAYAHGIALEADRVAVVMDARRAARADGPAHAVERERAGAVAVADDLYARMLVARDRLAARGTVLLPEPAAWFVTAQAEHARAHQRDEPAHWEAAAKAWAAVGQPVRLATAQLRQAEALVRRPGSRTEAAALLREAVDAADGIGARPLAAEIRALARRARLDIGAEPAAQVAAVPAVTPRELEVLRLLAQGRTNRQIGETLFISEKTASVHVTNLLRKLGVSSRVEAAAFAVRTGVADAAG